MAENLIRLSELARRSDVPAATIKHYVNKGLLPGPSLRTGRTMAYYDAALVSRVTAIKQLQTKRFLPLDVIKELLDGADPYRSEETEEALADALANTKDVSEERTRSQLIEGGMAAEQLDFFESIGFVTPRLDGDEKIYAGDDLNLLRTIAAARRAGLSPEMLPHTIVAPYVEAIQSLVRTELEMFREGLKGSSADDVAQLVQSATVLSEQLVVLLRRKMLLPTLRKLIRESAETEADA